MIYNNIVEDCFFQPRHAGMIDLNAPLTVHFRSSQKNQSLTIIDLYMQCTNIGFISQMRFKATGNPYVIAALEWLCRQLEGRTLENLPLINYQILIKELAISTIQYPIAIQVEDVYKEVLTLMKKKFEGIKYE